MYIFIFICPYIFKYTPCSFPSHYPLLCFLTQSLLTEAAVTEVLSEAEVAQLSGRDPAHLQSHGRALAHHLHTHAHGTHL